MPPEPPRRPAALSARRRRPDGRTLFLAVVSVLGAALVLARGLTHGPALHWDSINYLAVARNLLTGEGFLNYDGTPYTLWPPLYPLVLAVSGLGLLDPLAAAGPLNAALLGLTIFVAGRYLQRRLESRFLALWAPLVLALALPLGDLAWWALSEPLFVLLLTLALVAADDHLAEGRRSSLALAALCAALALLTRYQGVGVVAVVGLAPLFRRGDAPGLRVKRSALVFLAGLAPTALWLLRNARLTGGVTGHPPPDADALSWTLGLLLDGLARWIRFDGDFGPLVAAVFGGIPLAFLIAFLVARSESRPSGAAAKGPGWRPVWRPVAVFGGYCLANAVSLASAAQAVSIGAGSGLRYSDVAFLPAVVAAAIALDRLLRRERQRKLLGTLPGAGSRFPAPSLLTLLVTAGLTVWAVGQTARTARAIGRANSPTMVLETAYNAAPWTEIEALAHLREHPGAELVFTNLPPLPRIVIHHTTNGRAESRSLPLRAGADRRDGEPGRGAGAAGSPEPTPDERLRAFFDRAPEDALVLWLSSWSSGDYYDYGRAALRLQPALEPLAEFADGAVFRVDRRVDRRVNRAASPRPDPYRAAYESARPPGDGAEPEEAEADAGPDGESGFEVLLRPPGSSGLPGFAGVALLYLREPCGEDAVGARFFLHLYPEQPADRPAARRESGFANLDFRFAEHGVRLDGESSSPKCAAIVPLPDYGLRRIRTGQWTAGAGESWAVEIVPGESR